MTPLRDPDDDQQPVVDDLTRADILLGIVIAAVLLGVPTLVFWFVVVRTP